LGGFAGEEDGGVGGRGGGKVAVVGRVSGHGGSFAR
jgi:hypothetical protein